MLRIGLCWGNRLRLVINCCLVIHRLGNSNTNACSLVDGSFLDGIIVN